MKKSSGADRSGAFLFGDYCRPQRFDRVAGIENRQPRSSMVTAMRSSRASTSLPGPLTMVDILPISYSSPDCRMISRASSISSRKVSLPRGQKVSWQESQCSSGFLPHHNRFTSSHLNWVSVFSHLITHCQPGKEGFGQEHCRISRRHDTIAVDSGCAFGGGISLPWAGYADFGNRRKHHDI